MATRVTTVEHLVRGRIGWCHLREYNEQTGRKCCTDTVFQNAGLMTLIGIWGPTVASVANLLTIGLVAVADALWMGRRPDLQTIGGAGLICGGFAALLWEGDTEG